MLAWFKPNKCDLTLDDEPTVLRLEPNFETCPFWTYIYAYFVELGFQNKFYHVEISQGISSYNTTGVYQRDWYPVASGSLDEFKLEENFVAQVPIRYYLAPRKFYYLRIGLSSSSSGPVEFWGERLVDQARIPLSKLPDCCILADLCHEPGPRTPTIPLKLIPSLHPFTKLTSQLYLIVL